MKNASCLHFWEVFVTYHEPEVLEVTFLPKKHLVGFQIRVALHDGFSFHYGKSTSGRYVFRIVSIIKPSNIG